MRCRGPYSKGYVIPYTKSASATSDAVLQRPCHAAERLRGGNELPQHALWSPSRGRLLASPKILRMATLVRSRAKTQALVLIGLLCGHLISEGSSTTRYLRPCRNFGDKSRLIHLCGVHIATTREDSKQRSSTLIVDAVQDGIQNSGTCYTL